MRRGFTLIELMIVVAIIATLTAIVIPSLTRSRMAANETAAIAATKVYSEAQEIYRRTDYDGDAVLEYSQRLGGNFSLLENVSGVGDLSLVDRTFAQSEGQPTAVPPRAGYCFRIITSQGASGPGGALNYIVNSNMTLGYSISALPSAWDTSGRQTFMVSISGLVIQKDQGSGQTMHSTLYDPDSTWTPIE